VQVASPLRAEGSFAFSRLSIYLARPASVKRAVAGCPQATGFRAVNERRVAAHGVRLFVLHRQRLLVSYNSNPLPFRRTRAGMWPAVPCDKSSGLASERMGTVTFQGRHPFPLRHRKATRSHDSQEHGFNSPASLHIQSPTIGFIRSNIRGLRKMPVTPRIVAHATYHLLKMGSRGGALSVTVGSCRCKQEHGTRTRYHFAIPLSGL
jgi:hypothetical protein